MSLNQIVIDQLMSAYPAFVTYEHLIEKTDVSKNRIQHALKELCIQNYPIEIKNNQITVTSPLISTPAIAEHLDTRIIGNKMHVLPSLASTNTYAKNNLDSLSNGEVIFAHEQTSGKGRLGRTWSSPVGKSISMSLVLKPTMRFSDIALLTHLTAAALVDALEDWVDATIKWPNDVLINNKKIAGILIETEFSGGDLRGVIIGIGINTNLDQRDIPKDLQDKATSIKEQTLTNIDPNTLLSRFFTCFEHYYADFLSNQLTRPFLTVCRNRSVLLGKDFWIIDSIGKRKALIQDIDPAGGLVVTYRDTNQTVTLTSTDFSIRADNGYI